MTPCTGCYMPNTCRNYGQCQDPRRPETGIDAALKEAHAACLALEAAATRLNEATANLAAAQVIHKSQQQ